eukprot:569138_1
MISFSISQTIQFAIVLLFFHLQDEIVSDPNTFFNWISSPSQHRIRKYLLAFSIVSTLSTFFVKVIQMDSKTNLLSRATRHWFIIVGIAFAIHYHHSNFTLDYDTTTSAVVSSALMFLLCSYGIFKQWTMYLNTLHLNAILTNANHSTIPDYKSYKIVLFACLVVLNIVLNAYCITIMDNDISSFRFATSIWWLGVSTAASIPWHIKPKYKYDLYDYQLEMTFIHWFLNVLLIWQILWVLVLRYYLSVVFCHAIYILCLVCDNIPFMLSQCMEWWKQRRLAQNVAPDSMLWCDYIIQNNNFTHFLDFLLSIHCAETLLFVIDIVQYKNRLKQVLNATDDIEYGFVLGFEPNDILPTSNIVNNLMQNNLRTVTDKVYEDVDAFVAKYFDDGSIGTGLNVPFISCKDRTIIASKISDEFELKRNNMLNDDDCIRFLQEIIVLFDKQLIEINAVLQLLYREYQLDVY